MCNTRKVIQNLQVLHIEVKKLNLHDQEKMQKEAEMRAENLSDQNQLIEAKMDGAENLNQDLHLQEKNQVEAEMTTESRQDSIQLVKRKAKNLELLTQETVIANQQDSKLLIEKKEVGTTNQEHLDLLTQEMVITNQQDSKALIEQKEVENTKQEHLGLLTQKIAADHLEIEITNQEQLELHTQETVINHLVEEIEVAILDQDPLNPRLQEVKIVQVQMLVEEIESQVNVVVMLQLGQLNLFLQKTSLADAAVAREPARLANFNRLLFSKIF